MDAFCNDSDILKYEGGLFSTNYFSSQVICKGTGGVLSGTTFTAAGENFVESGVRPGGVIYLSSVDGIANGCFEIVSVLSIIELEISVLRVNETDDARCDHDCTDITFHAVTYAPQCRQVMLELSQYFGLAPGDGNSDFSVEDIVDTEGLRIASVYAVIAGLYATLATSTDGSDPFWDKSEYYWNLFGKARDRCRINIDVDNDGVGIINRSGGSVRLIRE